MKHFKNYKIIYITLSLMLTIYILYKFYIKYLICDYIKYKNLEKFIIEDLKIRSISQIHRLKNP